MKVGLIALACLFSCGIYGFEYEMQFENDNISVPRIKLMPHEELGLHRDVYPRVVVALQGGVVTRLETDGSTVDVEFPTGKAVFLDRDPPGQEHRCINNSDNPIELIIIQLKE